MSYLFSMCSLVSWMNLTMPSGLTLYVRSSYIFLSEAVRVSEAFLEELFFVVVLLRNVAGTTCVNNK